MKKILLLIFVLISGLLYSQRQDPIYSITDTTTLFTRVLPKYSLIKDRSQPKLYQVMQTCNIGDKLSNVTKVEIEVDFDTLKTDIITTNDSTEITFQDDIRCDSSVNIAKNITVGDSIFCGNDTILDNRISFSDTHNNLIIGRNAGLGITTEYSNTLIGCNSNKSNNVRYVTALGFNSMLLNTSNYSTFSGALTAQHCTDVYASTGMGFAVADSATTIDYYTGIGHVAARRVKVLDRSVSVGYSSHGNKDSVKYSVAIGHEASMGLGINQGYNSYNVVIGQYANRLSINSTKNVFIGANCVAEDSLSNSNNAIVGYNGFRRTNGNGNTALGYNVGNRPAKGYNFTQNNSIFIGNNVGSAIADTSDNLFIIGNDSITANKIMWGDINGINNTLTLNAITTIADGSTNYLTFAGIENVGLGKNSLGSPHSANGGCTAVGENSQQDQVNGYFNTSVGELSLGNLINGYSNTAIGRLAARQLESGNENTYIGHNSGNSNITGSRNIFIGNSAGANASNVSDRLYIAVTNTATPLIYGEFDNSLVKINGDLEVVSNGTAGIFKAGKFTAVQASALTPADGDFIYVTDTDATFTSVGFWGYENGSWVKL